MRDLESLKELVSLRWEQAQDALGPMPGFTWDIGDYPHFEKERGYAVTLIDSPTQCHIRFAMKILDAGRHRVDGIVRHEIGHVVDCLIPRNELDMWAHKLGVLLPKTTERRADAIAFAIWKKYIYYDEGDVQSTLHGVYPRPARLGL